MPAKATLAPSPFKGENFPQYVLCRSTRQQSITADATTDVQKPTTTPPATQTPAITLLTVAPKPDHQVPRRAGIPNTGFRRPLPSTSLRPSLSEQLKIISQGAQAITAQLATTYNLPRSNEPTLASSSSHTQSQQLTHDKNAFQATTIGLSVGKLECRFPCPATFASDRCTYLFQHPFEAKEVLMIMYYRDMMHASVNMADHSFRFRLSRVLEQFGDDYNPSNAQHWIRIVLATTSEANKVKLFLASVGVIGSRRPSRTEMSCNSLK